jgi:hypothetical protein
MLRGVPDACVSQYLGEAGNLIRDGQNETDRRHGIDFLALASLF